MTDVKRREIKVNFIDFVDKKTIENDWCCQALKPYYDLVLSDTPDYVFDGGLGHAHYDAKYDNCIKILTVGENYIPDFNLFDYAIGFDNLILGDRYLRAPLYVAYPEFQLLKNRIFPSDAELLNRKFCSFVVSDGGADPVRAEFFRALSKYKRVDSGGGFLNNIGGRVASKSEFCKQYKFNIAIENSSAPGYTTEKIMQAYAVNTVPIYFGNPTVEEDFHPESMVRIASRADIEKAIEEVVYLDTHDEVYLAKCHADCLTHSVEWHEQRLADFLVHIIEQPKDAARRLISYGNQVKYRNRYKRLYRIDDLWHVPALKLYNLKHRLPWRK